MIYHIGSIVVLQECTAQRIKDGEERHLLTIYQTQMVDEDSPLEDPEWKTLAKSEIVYDESMTMRKHFASLKEEARKKMKKYEYGV